MIAFLRFEIIRSLRNVRFVVMLIVFPLAALPDLRHPEGHLAEPRRSAP